jgi:hypothetical protein
MVPRLFQHGFYSNQLSIVAFEADLSFLVALVGVLVGALVAFFLVALVGALVGVVDGAVDVDGLSDGNTACIFLSTVMVSILT